MLQVAQQNAFAGNDILAALSGEEYSHLRPYLEIINLPGGQNIYNNDEELHYVYFPLDAVIYQFITMENGATVEAGVISNEGFLGSAVLMGSKITSNQAVSLMPKRFVRIKADIIKDEFEKGGLLRNLALRFIHSLYMQVSQTAACNHIHPLEAKLCRWLLMTHDRSKSDDLAVTHEFIGQMLGTVRPYVTTAIGILQKEGIIRCSRGHIKILNRLALEERACECYRLLQNKLNH